jgi:hypothetical protein
MPELDLFSIVILGFWAYCIFDVIRTPEGTTENLPKMFWLLIVIFLNAIGGLAWLLLGRPRNSTFSLRTNEGRRTLPPQEPTAPPVIRDDDYHRKREEALRRYHEEREGELRKKEEELRRREQELRQREQGSSESP